MLDTTTESTRRLRIAWLAVVAAGSVGIGLFTALLPGRSGAVGVRACALCMIAGFTAVSYLRSSELSGDAGSVPFGEALRSRGDSPRRFALAAAAVAFAFGVACGLFAGLPQAAFDLYARYAIGICGLFACALAIVLWAKSAERRLSSLASADSKGTAARELGPAGALCALLFVAGLACCMGIALTPLMNPGVWGLSAAGLCAVVTGVCGLALFHIPQTARQLDNMHGQLIEATHEKERYRNQAGTLAEEMADLREKHEDALQANEQLSATVDSMRKERLDASSEDGLEAACASVIEEFKLTRREGEVLVLLARGRSRKRIAEELTVELSTVSSHIVRLYRKLDVHSNQELIDLVRDRR